MISTTTDLQEFNVWRCRQYEHFALAGVLDTSVMAVVKSLVNFLGVWPELEALSLALSYFFSTMLINPLRFHSSSFMVS